MNYKIILPIFLVLVLTVFVLGGEVKAQSMGYDNPDEALAEALSDYMALIDEVGVWSMSEIFADEGFAYSIAKHQNLSDVEEGNLLILARQMEDGLWYTRTPEIDTPEEFNFWLAEFPDSLLSEFEKSYFYIYTLEELSDLSFRAVALHHFPWPIRQTAWLTQKGGSNHTNQLDFVIRESADVYASKPGVVIFKKESSNTGGCNINLWQYANLVVVQHSETEFTWYFHLKQNSVTVEVGDLIGYGTKIGEQGNTGFACGTTGIHLHFMVSTSIPTYWPNPENAALAPWPPGGSILPVDFREATWSSLVEDIIYTSQNAPLPGICSTSVSEVSLYDGTYCSSYLDKVSAFGLHELDLSGLEDKIESIEIPAGWSVNLYDNMNELSASLCLNQTDDMLWNNLFGDGVVAANRATWMRVFSSANCQLDFSTGVKLYAETNFTGTPVWGMVGTRSTDGPQHVVRSIAVPEGYSVKIWDQDGATGNELCLNTSAPDLSSIGWGGSPVESLLFVEGDLCGQIDTTPPSVTITSPQNGGNIVWPRANILVDGYDQWGIKLMYFFGWYDDGSGAGYDWHYLGIDEDERDGWQYLWNLTPLADSATALWVYAEDYSANYGSAFLSTLTMTRTISFGDGYESRGGGSEEGSGNDGENLIPPPLPEIPDFSMIPGFEDGDIPDEITTEIKPVETELEPISEEQDTVSIQPESDQGVVEAVESNSVDEGGTKNVEASTVLSPLKIDLSTSGLVYWKTVPELCWQQLSSEFTYFVRVEGAGDVIKSGWIEDACWQPTAAAGNTGDYTWKVKYRDTQGNMSGWSETAEFFVDEDLIEPFVKIISASYVVDEFKNGNTIALSIENRDGGSGIQTVYVLAWYDDGIGEDWHQLAVVSQPAAFLELNVGPLPDQIGKLWVYVEDMAGNFGSASIKGHEIAFSSAPETVSGMAVKHLLDARILSRD